MWGWSAVFGVQLVLVRYCTVTLLLKNRIFPLFQETFQDTTGNVDYLRASRRGPESVQ